MMDTELFERFNKLPIETKTRFIAGMRLLLQIEEKRKQIAEASAFQDGSLIASMEVSDLKQLQERLSALF